MNKYFLQISIPTYNRAQSLEKTLINLFKIIQKYKSEILIKVIDNHSSNYNFIEFNKKLKSISIKFQFDNFHIIRNDINIGSAKNVLKCFENVNAKWLWVLADDDDLNSNAINIIFRYLKNKFIEDNVDAIKFSSNLYKEKKSYLIKERKNLFLNNDNFNSFFSNLMFVSNYIFKTKNIENRIAFMNETVGGYCPQLFYIIYNHRIKTFFSKFCIVNSKYGEPSTRWNKVISHNNLLKTLIISKTISKKDLLKIELCLFGSSFKDKLLSFIELQITYGYSNALQFLKYRYSVNTFIKIFLFLLSNIILIFSELGLFKDKISKIKYNIGDKNRN